MSATSRTVYHVPRGDRAASCVSWCASTFTDAFSTTTSASRNTVFDPELEHIGQLAGRCFTELIPAWLMLYLFVRYLVLISLRFIWRQAGLVCHRNCLLPQQGRCPSTIGTVFDYGRHCSLLALFVHCSPQPTSALDLQQRSLPSPPHGF